MFSHHLGPSRLMKKLTICPLRSGWDHHPAKPKFLPGDLWQKNPADFFCTTPRTPNVHIQYVLSNTKRDLWSRAVNGNSEELTVLNIFHIAWILYSFRQFLCTLESTLESSWKCSWIEATESLSRAGGLMGQYWFHVNALYIAAAFSIVKPSTVTVEIERLLTKDLNQITMSTWKTTKKKIWQHESSCWLHKQKEAVAKEY